MYRISMLSAILVLSVFSTIAYSGDNPELMVEPDSSVSGPTHIELNDTASFTATLTWPSGVANPGGECTWSFIPTSSHGAAVTINGPNPEPPSDSDTFVITVRGTGGGAGKLQASWTTSAHGYTSPATGTADIEINGPQIVLSLVP